VASVKNIDFKLFVTTSVALPSLSRFSATSTMLKRKRLPVAQTSVGSGPNHPTWPYFDTCIVFWMFFVLKKKSIPRPGRSIMIVIDLFSRRFFIKSGGGSDSLQYFFHFRDAQGILRIFL